MNDISTILIAWNQLLIFKLPKYEEDEDEEHKQDKEAQEKCFKNIFLVCTMGKHIKVTILTLRCTISKWPHSLGFSTESTIKAVLDLKDRLEKYHNIDTAAEIKVKTCITTIMAKSRA